jgi:hypothetical protein
MIKVKEHTPERWVDRARASQHAYLEGWLPYRAVLESLNLPPRGKRGSKRNRERQRIVVEALRREKLRLGKESAKRKAKRGR